MLSWYLQQGFDKSFDSMIASIILILPTLIFHISTLETKTNVVVPIKTVHTKNDPNKWFDGEISEKNHTWDKSYKRFSLTKLYVGKGIYKEAQIAVEILVQKKKRAYLEEKLKANTSIPKIFLDILALPSKRSASSDMWLKKKEGVFFDHFAISEVFQKFYSTVTIYLL